MKSTSSTFSIGDRDMGTGFDMMKRIVALEAALIEARDAAHSLAHSEFDGVWSEEDFAGLTPLADALIDK